jgi:hypothetical protein
LTLLTPFFFGIAEEKVLSLNITFQGRKGQVDADVLYYYFYYYYYYYYHHYY